MATDETMNIDERYKYLRLMYPRYKQAGRKLKSQLLDEMEAVTGLHRKTLQGLLREPPQRKRRERERKRTYKAEFDTALAVIWETLDHICPLRLKPNLVSTGQQLAKFGEITWSPKLAQQLADVSVSSIRRHLPPRTVATRRRKPTTPPNRHQQQMQAYRIPRDIAEVGHFEVDLVHHCGTATEGEYIYTLQMIDVATGWGARRAILGRSYVVMADALAYLFAQVPFPIRELHPDNGSEFLNAHLLTFLEQAYPACDRTRSRPATPNDNRLVEEKNSSAVRRYLGDRRLDTVTQTRFLNTIYDKLHIYLNYFIPVLKQIDKQYLPSTATRQGYIKRIHDPARTPLDRWSDLDPNSEAAQALCHQRDKLNPRELRRTIYRDLDHLFAYPAATPGQVENIFETLADPDRFPEAVAALRAVDTVDKPKNGLPTVSTAPTTMTNFSLSGKEAA